MSIKEFNQMLDELEVKYHRTKREILTDRDAWIGTQWPMYKSGKFTIAENEWCQWECEESPIGICIYNDEDDIVHDFCHFCGLPEERK